MVISGHVTPGNDPCNLCHNGAIKLLDKLQEKLSIVTAPLVFEFGAQLIFRGGLLFLEGSLSSSDLVAFLSGLLLGGDTKARNCFSSFVRIGQKVQKEVCMFTTDLTYVNIIMIEMKKD